MFISPLKTVLKIYFFLFDRELNQFTKSHGNYEGEKRSTNNDNKKQNQFKLSRYQIVVHQGSRVQNIVFNWGLQPFFR